MASNRQAVCTFIVGFAVFHSTFSIGSEEAYAADGASIGMPSKIESAPALSARKSAASLETTVDIAQAATTVPTTEAAAIKNQTAVPARLDAGNTAWMLTATALVLLMTLPGVALFYAGMVRKKNVLATMTQVFAIAVVVTLTWFIAGYSIALRPGNEWFGFMDRLVLDGMTLDSLSGVQGASIPESVYMMFQLTFAIITMALVPGAFAERVKFSALVWIAVLWSLLVYAPVAHWVWEPGGWLAQLGMLDYAGGTVVHVNAGVAGLVCAVMLGRRVGFGTEPMMPHNLAFAVGGASLLWVGWFGFNAGSAVAADARAGMAMATTQIATAAAAFSWMCTEWMLRGRPSALGLASGAIAGLVAVTPASGYVDPQGALVIGLVAGVMCYFAATSLKRILGYDDSLDVFGIHGVGGAIGAVLTGIFAKPEIGGASGDVFTQLVGVSATAAYSMVMTWLILVVVGMLVGLRVNEDHERVGLDVSQHGEHVA